MITSSSSGRARCIARNTSVSAASSCGTSSGSVWVLTSQKVKAASAGVTSVRNRATIGGRWSRSEGSGILPSEAGSTAIRVVS
jgi:hypothetical protein